MRESLDEQIRQYRAIRSEFLREEYSVIPEEHERLERGLAIETNFMQALNVGIPLVGYVGVAVHVFGAGSVYGSFGQPEEFAGKILSAVVCLGIAQLGPIITRSLLAEGWRAHENQLTTNRLANELEESAVQRARNSGTDR